MLSVLAILGTVLALIVTLGVLYPVPFTSIFPFLASDASATISHSAPSWSLAFLVPSFVGEVSLPFPFAWTLPDGFVDASHARVATLVSDSVVAQDARGPTTRRQTVALTGPTVEWTLRASDRCAAQGHAVEVDSVRLPVRVHDVLLERGLIPDPHLGMATGSEDVQWVARCDWTLQARVQVPQEVLGLDSPLLLLSLDSIDTAFRVQVQLSKSTSASDSVLWFPANLHTFQFNQHRRHVLLLDPAALLAFDTGDTVFLHVRLELLSPYAYGELRRKQFGAYPIWHFDYDHHDPPTPWNFVRKNHANFGWDWGPSDTPALGVRGEMGLHALQGVLIDDVSVDQRFEWDADELHLTVTAFLRSSLATTVRVSVSVLGRTVEVVAEIPGDAATSRFDRPLQVAPEPTAVPMHITLPISSTALWYPVGYGVPTMHRVTVEAGAGASFEFRTGFRDVAVDESGNGFQVLVNRVPVYVRGSSWVPTDVLPYSAESPRARAERLMDDALAIHTNTLRVWGGGQYEPEWFYDMADERGLLLWQDFMFACSMYPDDANFLDNVAREVRTQARRLSRHASVAVWCGNNENEWQLKLMQWGPLKNEPMHVFRQLGRGYYKLVYQVIQPALLSELPSVFFWPSSPTNTRATTTTARFYGMDTGYSNEDSRGTVHSWDVWFADGQTVHGYERQAPRFVAEFGIQSIPDMKSMRRSQVSAHLEDASADYHALLEADDFEFRQRCPYGSTKMLEHVTNHFREPRSLGDFVYLTQVFQGFALRSAIQHWRMLKPYCSGTIMWQLNDVWVAPTWSTIDFYGEWKASHYALGDSFSPWLGTVALDYLQNSTVSKADTAKEDVPVHELDVVARVTYDGAPVSLPVGVQVVVQLWSWSGCASRTPQQEWRFEDVRVEARRPTEVWRAKTGDVLSQNGCNPGECFFGMQVTLPGGEPSPPYSFLAPGDLVLAHHTDEQDTRPGGRRVIHVSINQDLELTLSTSTFAPYTVVQTRTLSSGRFSANNLFLGLDPVKLRWQPNDDSTRITPHQLAADLHVYSFFHDDFVVHIDS